MTDAGRRHLHRACLSRGATRRPARRVAPRPVGSGWRQRLEIAFFVTPALALMAVFVVWPVVSAVRMSFYRWKGFGPMDDFIGIDNYGYVLTDDVFTGAVTHNFIIVFASILVQLPLGLAVALLLDRRIRGRGLLRTIVFVPYVVAEVIAGVVWYQLLQPESGVIDGLSGGSVYPARAGLPRHSEPRARDRLRGAHLEVPRAGDPALPRRPPGRAHDLFEAAQLDGASWWQVQRRIAIPLLGPTIRTWCFLSMIGSLQLFDMVWILTGGGPANATTTMATYLINQGTGRHNYGIAGAASVVLFVIGFLMALIYQVFVLRRDTAVER